MKLFSFVSVVALAVLVLGLRAEDEPAFKSKDAKEVKEKYEEAKKVLDDAYFRELNTLKKTYIAGLTAARKTAIDKNDLDEAQAIATLTKELEASLKKPEEPEAPPTKATKLDTKDLVGKKYRFFTAVATDQVLTFGKDGKIQDNKHPNETFWRLSKEGRLTFLNQDGKTVTNTYENVFSNGKSLVIQGSGLDRKGIAFLLQESK